MRVLFVNDLPLGEGGGAEVVLARQAAALRAAGHEVRVWAGEVRHEGAARVLDIWDPVARRRLGAVAGRWQPDVVHHHNVLRELSVSVLGVPRGVPQVMTLHDARLLGDQDQPRRGVQALVGKRLKDPLDQRTVRRRVDALLAVSAGLTARLVAAGFPQARHLTVPGPAGDPPTGPPPSASSTVLFLGRLSADKGLDTLIEAWPEVLRQHPTARLAVAGEGSLRAAVAELANVDVLGRVGQANVPGLLMAARVVVVPSKLRPEGAPLVAVEAAWAGRPLVVSDDPGLAELATGLPGARVVPAGDALALAEALAAVLADPAAADEAGAANQLAARRHAPERCVADLVALYEELRSSA